MRVGLLCDTRILEWEDQAVERMLEETDAEVSLVVVNGSLGGDEGAHQPTGSFSIGDLRVFLDLYSSEGAWALVLAVRKVIRALGGFEPELIHTKPLDTCEWFPEIERIECDPMPSRETPDGEPDNSSPWVELPHDVVDRISETCDVVVRFGFGLIEGDVLSATPHGVLSFHGTDVRKYRGLGTTERYLEGDTVAGATLQQLTPTIDGGNVVEIAHVNVGDVCHMEVINERIHELQIKMLARGIRRLEDPDFSPKPPDELGNYTSLSKRRELRYALRIVWKELQCLLRNMTRRSGVHPRQ